MFTSVRRCISNVLASLSGSNRGASGGNNIVLLTGVRKLTRTGNASGGGGLKAALTTALLFIMGTLYCLYGTGNSTARTVTPLAYGQKSLGVSDVVSVQTDPIAVAAMMPAGNEPRSLVGGCNNSKKQRKKPPPKLKPTGGGNGVLTAADMYEPGFRIQNSGLCTERTQLLVLITSAAAPSHSQHRQAIRMTWMNRYGPSVTMAFLVGTPQMSETDPVAQILEAEEKALRIRLNKLGGKHNDKPNEKTKPKPGMVDANVNPRLYRFSKDQEPHLGEGLDTRSMNGLNEAERAVQRVLGREHSRYGDLVQCQSRDTYTNLTLKSIAALEWTREFCPSARYLLKTDDDMFIDVRRLLRFIDKVETDAAAASTDISGLHSVNPINGGLNELPSAGEDKFESSFGPSYDIELPPTIWGRLGHGWRPIRQHNSKYYVSRAQYAGRVYPDFCTGPAYLMTRSAVSPLYEGALGRDFYLMDLDEDDEQYDDYEDNEIDSKNFKKNCSDSNETLITEDSEKTASVTSVDTGKNTVPYLKLEDVYLTGVVAERLTRQAAERQARRERKDKDKISSDDGKHNQKTSAPIINQGKLRNGKKNKLKADDIIVKVRRVHNDQFANKKITGRALDRAVCNGVNSGDNSATDGSGGFSWFHWYWGNTAVDKDSKKKKKDQGVISVHMVKYYEQFDLWRRLMDGRTKCKP